MFESNKVRYETQSGLINQDLIGWIKFMEGKVENSVMKRHTK